LLVLINSIITKTTNQNPHTMRKSIFILGILLFSGFTLHVFAQKEDGKGKATGSQAEIIDHRIDNIRYWMRLAEKGLVPYNPFVSIPPAIYKGSTFQIKSGGVPVDSPDIPVTSLSTVTESENSAFIDPDNNMYLLNSNNSTAWSGGTVGSLYGANYFQSSDGAATFGGSVNGAGGSNSGDPTTAINHAGRQFVNFIDDPGGQAIAYSDDGVTWSTSTIATNPGDLADKNHMWIDNKTTSPYLGNIYCAWTDFGGTYDYQVVLSRSTDNGVTWSSKIPISGLTVAPFNHGVNLQTGPNGQVYACWATYASTSTITETGIGFTKSLNGGTTFSTAVNAISNIKGIRSTGVLKDMRVNSFPVMAVDISGGPNNGNIYIVWTNIGTPLTNTGTNKSVYMIRSTDQGTTWSTPIKVNQGTFADGKEAYCPWITCDPETGNLAVIFYDDRATASTACETWVAYSTNAGNNWTDFRVSDVSFTPTAIPGLASSYMGDYLSITSKGGRVYPVWTDTRGGEFKTYVSPFIIGLNASFTASATNVCTGGSVTFADHSTGPPTNWQWSFPGGTPSSYTGATPPAITYNTPGTYDVTLVVTDATGTDTETKTGFVTVANVFADFSASSTRIFIGNSITFTNLSTCSPTTWNWSFPGGTPSSFSGANPPAITYSTVGTYDVILSVTKGTTTDVETKTGYIQVLPPEFIMSTSTVSTCTGNFYDPGGSAGVYSNSQDYTMTFNPLIPGNILKFIFNSFELESQSTCNYDYLKIYDGNSTSAPLIGTYCGTTSPGTVIANSTGSLTFVFHSDVSLTYSGWSASISCVAGVVTNPSNFVATPFSASQIDLGWALNSSGHNVMVLYAPTSSFGTPVDGTTYAVGSSLSGGGTVIYSGTGTSYHHLPLNPNTTYYYKAYSFDGVHTYSTGVTANATTLCGVNMLPLTENFTASTLPNCWATQVTGTGGVNKWTVSTTTNAGGTANEMKSTYQSVSPGITRLVTVPINTLGMTLLNLSFRHMLDAYSTGCTLRVQSSTDGITWTNEAWSVATTATNIAATLVTTTVVNNLNSANTLIAFTIEGNLYNYDYWYIDNVSITGNAKTLNLTLFLEGLFNGTAMNKAKNATGDQFSGTIADQITVELHNSTSPYALVAGPYTVNINQNGTTALTVPASFGASYYIVVKHRNSVETWNGSPVSFSGASVSYNFTSSAAQAYGNNLKLVSGNYVVYGGDVNQDGVIDTGDLTAVDNDSKDFLTGYLNTDVNGDGIVNASDLPLVNSNGGLFVAKITP
jgi:PKD repeat protein